MSFKSPRVVFCQFFHGLPGFLCMLLRFQFKVWFSILQSFILFTCSSHLNLLSLIISSSFAIPVLFCLQHCSHCHTTLFPIVVTEIYGVLLHMFEFEAAHHKLHMFEFSQVNKTYRMKKSVNSVTMFKYFFVINFKSNPLQLWVCFKPSTKLKPISLVGYASGGPR